MTPLRTLRKTIDASSNISQDRMAKRHTYAWYTYAFAAEVFSACAMAIFLPITLEQMAREVGYLSPSFDIPCINPTGTGEMEGVGSDEGTICKAKMLGGWVDTASFSMYMKSIAVAFQAITIITFGPLSDSPFWRKRLLGVFAYIGSISGISLLFFPSHPNSIVPIIAALLTVIGNVGYANSIVCANAFLPSLAKEDPRVIAVTPSPTDSQSSDGDEERQPRDGGLILGQEEHQALLSDSLDTPAILSNPNPDLTIPLTAAQKSDDYSTLLSLTTSRISSIGTGIGFFSGVTVLAMLMIPVVLGQGSTKSLRLAIGLSGFWWGVFTLPALVGLPGGSSRSGQSHQGTKRTVEVKDGLLIGWKRVGRMVSPKEIRRLPNLFTLLLAWVFLSDGFHTTTYTAILYASSTLHLPPFKIIIIGILVQLSAVFSSILTPKYQRSKGYSNLTVLKRIVLLALILPLYTCLGLLIPFGGLRSEWEMYVAATWFGILYGPFNSYSRAVYAELIPIGHESSFFSLFALTDKSASFLGPFVVGFIADTTGNIRLGFLFLLLLLVAPVPVLNRLDMEEGKKEAKIWTSIDR